MTPWHYVCELCGQEEALAVAAWRCPVCSGAFGLDGPNRLLPTALRHGAAGLWRYASILPVPSDEAVSLGEGMTPLVKGQLAGASVWFKLDALMPTGSFKDRGAAVLTAHLRRLGLRRIIVDSSGNAAAAMAGYGAAAGLDCTIYASSTVSRAKLVQARAYGATVMLVEGDREAVARAAREAATSDSTEPLYASHNWHAVFVERVKTWALEVWEQLGQRLPAVAFIPTGGGSALVGAHRGFAALPGPLPALVAAQPAACAPIAAVSLADRDIPPVIPEATIAEGTRIGAPTRPRQILTAMRDSGGRAVAVSEREIVAALRELWAHGLYVEPTAAVGAAACRAAVMSRWLPAGEVVVLLTGTGLKATATISGLLDAPGQ